MSCLTRDRVRAVDRLAIEQLGIPSLVLMENAARGLVSFVISLRKPHSRILVLCGHGNNGGDGLAATRLFAAQGQSVDCCIVSPKQKLSDDAEANFRILANAGINVPRWSPSELIDSLASLQTDDVIIDAILGTGVRGEVRKPFDEVIETVNASSATVVAVDLPSGLDCDSGAPCGHAIRARHTVTFVAAKQGFQQPEARQFTGDVTVCDIGIPINWLTEQFPELKG